MGRDTDHEGTLTSSAVFGEEEELVCLRALSSPDPKLLSEAQIPVDRPLQIGRTREDEEEPAPCSGRLFVKDGRISRDHAVLRPDKNANGWLLEDLGSKNGSWVNGRRVAAAKVVPGDLLRLGETLLLICPTVAPGCLAAPTAEPGSLLLGSSLAMVKLRLKLKSLAVQPISVLLAGESGTGKELAAMALHRLSERPGRMVAVNCSAIPESLFESELFGARKGAFSGATESRKGLVQEADRGTLFLDEIGQMPLPLQSKLLRVLEQREVCPVGSLTPVAVDLRVVAATNADLEQLVTANRFRLDLLHRINQYLLLLPPLRARREEIPELWHHFTRAELPDIEEPEANLLEALLVHDWPGNVRELRNAALTFVAQVRAGAKADFRALPQHLVAAYRTLRDDGQSDSQPPFPHDPVLGGAPAFHYSPPRDNRPSREALEAALGRHRNNLAAVAREFGCHRQQLYRWLRACGIERDCEEKRN